MEKTTLLPGSKRPSMLAVGSKQIGPYYWVGHNKNGIDYYAGQTFKSPTSGKISTIKLFTSMVYGETEAKLSIYEFDSASHQWKNKKGEVKTFVNKNMEGNWIAFDLKDIDVKNGAEYAFKISCNNGGMLAIAESPWHTFNQYADGEEWIGSSESEKGNFYNDFDLAFEVEFEPAS